MIIGLVHVIIVMVTVMFIVYLIVCIVRLLRSTVTLNKVLSCQRWRFLRNSTLLRVNLFSFSAVTQQSTKNFFKTMDVFRTSRDVFVRFGLVS